MSFYKLIIRIVLLLIIYSAYMPKIDAIVPILYGVDSVNATTLSSRSYYIATTLYTQGSLHTKAILGVHDNIYLGVSFDIQSLVGIGRIAVNIPGVVAKFKITDGWEKFPILIAFGYDSFYTGNEGRTNSANPLNKIIYGTYISFTKPLFILEGTQHIHFGVKMPIQPHVKPEDTALFLSIDIPIGYIVPIVEISRLYLTRNRINQALFNVGVQLNFIDNLVLQFSLMFAHKEPIERILTLQYSNEF